MILSVEGLSFRYMLSERDALRDVSFSVERGEYIAVLGANGSGKSTLLRCIAGLAHGSSNMESAIRIFSEHTQNGGKTEGGIIYVPTAVVFQAPDDQIVAETVELDAAFGPENLSIPRKEMHKRVEDALSLFLPDAKGTARTEELSTGQKQRLALAGANTLNPDILLLDEPSSMISEKDRDALLGFLDAACSDGKTIFHVTHYIDEAMRASRIIILSDGALVFDGSRDEFKLFPNETLAQWSLIYKEENSNISNMIEESEELPLLACTDLSAGPFCGVSLSLRAGEIAAVTGESGSGKSLLLLSLAGILAAESGKIDIKAESRVALAVQESETALFEEFVADDVAFALESSKVPVEELKEVVREVMDAAGLPFEKFADRKTFSLSGGEKRKAAIAGIIATGSDVLLFDEPFSALDANARGEIGELFKRLAKSGKAVMFSANRRADFEGLADKVISLDSFQKPQAEAQEAEAKESLRNEPPLIFATMPPVAKFLLCAVAVAATLLMANWAPLSLYALFLIVAARLSGYSLFKLFKAVLRILPWLLIIIAIQCFILKDAAGAALFFLRFLCLLTELSLFVFLTPPTEISCGAEAILFPLRLFRIPVRNVALLISLVFRFFPFLYAEAEKIKIARRVRTEAFGGGTGKRKKGGRIRETVALIVPLVMRTLIKAEKLSLAIAARYYSAGKHTRYLMWKLKFKHAALIILLVAFSAFLVWVSRAWM